MQERARKPSIRSPQAKRIIHDLPSGLPSLWLLESHAGAGEETFDQVSSSQEDHPRDCNVEEPHRVQAEQLAVIWHQLSDEPHGSAGSPCEACSDEGHLQPVDPEQHRDERGDHKREDAVAQHADGLEEGHLALEEQRVEGHDGGAHPHGDEDVGESIAGLVGGGRLQCEDEPEREAKHQGSPQVPVLQAPPPVSGAHGHEYIHELLENGPEVTHDGLRHWLMERALQVVVACAGATAAPSTASGAALLEIARAGGSAAAAARDT
eukprot:CAMPEP_0179250562 /NCGR_PEP_ID=MMETSP0797-20121207/21233_1 /TAXON_ID=47934 /ORGANISM="Dinophysis acuminata, Strain DAEP01" /LENGTH=264 /DNA_ID=CAMNT_0020958305 /DNA_START=88 /DNA_END=878 /DNA_ORIENTATION=+